MLQVNPKWMVFFFSLTSELKNQLFTQLLFKMAWNRLIVHVGSYLLCDFITALLILALFPPGFVVFCSVSDHRLLQSDILPSWHLRSVCRAIIAVPVVHKQHRVCPSRVHQFSLASGCLPCCCKWHPQDTGFMVFYFLLKVVILFHKLTI